MNKALKVAGLSFALMAAGMGSALAETKIAVVDMGEVFQKLPQREASPRSECDRAARVSAELEIRVRSCREVKKDEALRAVQEHHPDKRPKCNGVQPKASSVEMTTVVVIRRAHPRS